MHNLQIDGRRLWDTIIETARIGGTAKGGVRRLTLTDLDAQVRVWFRAAAEAAGCTVSLDDMGNMFARRPGRADIPPIGLGSHLDTQPTGGKFDGILGVLAALEAVRTLNDAGFETYAPIEIINWTNEEGSRFNPAMLSSGVFAGAFTRDHAYAITDKEGVTFGEALEAIGYRGEEPCGQHPLSAFFELHIEQGPILEAEAKQIGVVTGAQGTKWYKIRVNGMESHAGTTPMPRRRDALVAAARLVQAINRIALDHGPDGVGTVGELDIVSLPSINVIPGEVRFTIDYRHPDGDQLNSMDRAFRAAVAEIVAEGAVEIEIDQIWDNPPTPFDPECVDAVRQAAAAAGYGHRDIVSGAGHDAVYVARVAPTAMVFVPCENGISHNEIENATQEDCAAGANVLLQAALAYDRKLAEATKA